ncbi:MarR family winged helix-turn-helix transcriptional regulator [Novosphingobium mangrovi (ex Huang et al. 2023)]|uniref:MarR family transcriptional regulator n=1 Tax=Novosphingobium mangrovi (ex Huang et al. 2023) TaxID=2976432 RepID=A0ABT2I5A7_9SPHN|nr:helix-turn-helix domain-containing protein [Novosphingobium mangrovi (ex Huang et al. 2023)]MCT2400006.1 MarR family transcriptional regulator [Novosphingobium mangrovi (ex Huang et al. 2023)]
MSKGPFDSRHPLVGLVDETIRLNSRLRSAFAAARADSALNDSEQMVLNAVVEAEKAPTVAQIGRSMGQARQLVQRAANSLRESGLIEMVDNPDHKRAPLLRATQPGLALKRELDARAEAIAEDLLPAADLETVREATRALRTIRRKLEAQLRAR